MAGKVFFSVSMSLDGFMAPKSSSELMGQQWLKLQGWVLATRFFRENLKFGEGGEEGRDNDIARQTYARTGASIMGKRMFDAGERMWPEEAPFHTPVFVLTHHARPSIEMEGGTVFHFVDASPPEALDLAQEAAGALDVRIGGGPTVVRDFLAADLIDTLHVVQVPILLGRGTRLWDGLEGVDERYAVEAVSSPSGVTHLTFRRR